MSAIYEENYFISMKKLIFLKLFKDILIFFIVFSLSLSIIVWVIQAVNFLDFVSEDGHGFNIYFSYTLLNFPKIYSKLFLITFFISLIYVIIKYEENNELILFWITGISKMKFAMNVLKFSIFFFIMQAFLTIIITPITQDLARSYIRNSNIDMFPSLISEKKFIDTVSDLTIYIDEIDRNENLMINIFIKDQSSGGENFQLIVAKEGELVNINNNSVLILREGEIFNKKKNSYNSFKFENLEFNLSRFTTKTTTIPKIQETETSTLIKCIMNNSYNKSLRIDKKRFVCDIYSTKNVSEELLKRLYLPLYLPLISLIGCLIILKSKEEKSFNNFKKLIFLFGFMVIFFSEASIKFASKDLINNYLFFLMPIIFYFIIFLFFQKKLKYKII